MGTFLFSTLSIVGSDRAHSGLLRTIIKSFGNKKLTRLDSNHMCGAISLKNLTSKCKEVRKGADQAIYL